MQGRVKVTAMLQNPDGVFDDELGPFEYSAENRAGVCTHVLKLIQSTGGLLRILGDDEVEFISLNRVKTINIKLTELVVADNSDLMRALSDLRMPAKKN